MSKYTPGPWEFKFSWVQTSDERKTPIANFNFHAATEENARLIAAAPDLLEALRLMRNRFLDTEGNHGQWEEEAIDAADAAIAKATGEQQ